MTRGQRSFCGPVTYEMEANGGYLSVGKLTGKLDTERGGRGTGEESSLHPSSFILHPFVIHTPTATVTDLGTEFGVEVSKEGRHHVARLPRVGQAVVDTAMERLKKLPKSCTRTNRPAWRIAAVGTAAIAS